MFGLDPHARVTHRDEQALALPPASHQHPPLDGVADRSEDLIAKHRLQEMQIRAHPGAQGRIIKRQARRVRNAHKFRRDAVRHPPTGKSAYCGSMPAESSRTSNSVSSGLLSEDRATRAGANGRGPHPRATPPRSIPGTAAPSSATGANHASRPRETASLVSFALWVSSSAWCELLAEREEARDRVRLQQRLDAPGRPVELHIGVRAAQSTPIIRSGASIFARIQTNNSSSLATMSPGVASGSTLGLVGAA